ncbi:MAG: LysM peptidoglycan-binding domain-containing protein [Smithellaceae bacterium]|nr:LysM peptidoglycan-binding domain-containing protein [Smithellaceae bacterium]
MTSKAADKRNNRTVKTRFGRRLAALLSGVFLFPLICAASPKDDTAYITLEMDKANRRGIIPYTVRAGDTLGRILRRELGSSPRDLRAIKEQNPHIRDLNLIYPGQTIFLQNIPSATDREPPPQGSHSYRVEKGDSLGAVIKRKLNLTGADLQRAMSLVKKINPDLKNIHNIFPGQKIILPGTGKTPPAAQIEAPPQKKPVEESAGHASLPMEETLEVIETVMKRMGARLIRNGTYHVPLPELGSFSLDNAVIPMIEFADGSVAFIDFRQRIPEEIRRSIARSWRSHAVISPDPGSTIPLILEKTFAAKESYQFKRLEQPLLIGTTAQVQLQADWLISWPRGKEAPPGRQALIFTKEPAHLLPGHILRFAEKTGLAVTEMPAGRKVARELPPNTDQKSVISLGGNSVMEMSRDFLTFIGLAPQERVEVNIFESARDGFKLSITADLLVSVKNRRILFLSRPLPGQFVSQLGEGNFEVVTITEGTAKTAALEVVITALQLPYTKGIFSFSLPGKPDGQVNTIAFPGIRVLGERGPAYLIDFDLDPDLYAYLRAQWRLNLARY